MANYLPVLLVSVNASATPDDNVLTNAPCGQVDYLSHDWQEEDVWRSWRNMTRQKNEITNGLRLENASWRTWWKQRNNLKTVSPETLNWLKDSDVTWLYGPLHTAVDWSPPPKPDPVPDSVDRTNPPSTQDRLDLHSSPAKTPCQPQPPTTKPILKHRSISELLTFDLPASPVFSPHESDNDDDDAQSSTQSSKRPCLPYTKSDTHITRWGPSRTFRKDSPPRVLPPGRKTTVCAPGAVRTSLSQDSTSSASANGSTERPPKRKHISFNTFVEQCIAIDKHPRLIPKRRAGFGFGDYVDNEFGYDDQGEDGGNHRWEDDDGYEEDREDNLFGGDGPLWLAAHGGARPRRRHLNGSAIHSDSDSDDGVIEIRPSTYRHSDLGTPHAKKKAPPRSKSASSSSSATTSTTTSSTSSSAGFRQRRKSASAVLDGVFPPNLLSVPPQTSAYRPRPSHTDPPYRDRVTIAPIAPTFLKTTGVWEEGFGDEGGASDDGLWDYGVPKHGVDSRSGGSDDIDKRGNKYDEEQSSDGTPVELVYVPPFGSIYGHGAQAYWRNRREQAEDMEDEEDEMTENVEEQFAPSEEVPKVNPPQKEDSPASASLIPQELTTSVSRSPVPVVIIDSSADSESALSESDRNECNSNSSNSTSTTTTPVPVPSRRFQSQEEERGRGRSLSVSPVGGTSSNSKAPAPASAPVLPSSGSSGGLLTSRGRSQSCQDLQSFYNASVATTSIQNGERRGRSSMRGPSTGSNSTSMRGINSSRSSQSHSGGRSSGSVSPYNSSTSPIGGSLSPDGGDTRPSGGIGSVYASGRMGGRERESRFERNSSSSSLSSKATSTGSDERRGRDRGTRGIGSGSGSSTSPVPSTSSPEESRGRSGRSIRDREEERPNSSPQAVLDIEPAPGSTSSSPVTVVAPGILGRSTKESSTFSAEGGALINGAPKMEMDASICSGSSEGSTATIVPTSNVVSPKHKVATVKAQAPVTPALDVPSSSELSDREREMQFEREALEEADRRRKNVPTPSNSPTTSMTASVVTLGSTPTTKITLPSIQTSIEYSPKHIRTSSSSSTYSPNSPSSSKYKPKSPPIVPSPPHPAPPSTSSSHAPGEVGASGIFTTNGYIRSASTSLERASSGSRERQSPSSSTASSSSGGSTIPYAGSGLRKEITSDGEFERELAEARRGRNGGVSGRATKMWMNGNGGEAMGTLREPTSPMMDGGHGRERGTIMDKAVGMVSSAGAYLKWWPGQSYGAGAGAAQ